MDCFLQAELCQQPRWSEAAAAAAAAAAAVGNDTATPPADVVVDGKKPMLFVVRKGKVFGYDGDAAASRAAEMVQFVKVVAEIGEDALEDEDGLGDGGYGDGDEVWVCCVVVTSTALCVRSLEREGYCARLCVFLLVNIDPN